MTAYVSSRDDSTNVATKAFVRKVGEVDHGDFWIVVRNMWPRLMVTLRCFYSQFYVSEITMLNAQVSPGSVECEDQSACLWNEHEGREYRNSGALIA